MSTPLLDVTFPSTYFKDGRRLPVPKRMAHATPDMFAAMRRVATALEDRGGHLFISDLFRSYDMQLQSHLDWKNKKKSAFSPPPGGSLHEAGRAFDLDLDSLNIKLSDFWVVAREHGLSPIINTPTSGASESWHFDCRGSHDLVYQYYKNGKGKNFDKPYQAMAASAILSIGVKVDKFNANQTAAAVQCALVRLGQDIGNIDGSIGQRSRAGLAALGVPLSDPETMLPALEAQLKIKFPHEFAS